MSTLTGAVTRHTANRRECWRARRPTDLTKAKSASLLPAVGLPICSVSFQALIEQVEPLTASRTPRSARLRRREQVTGVQRLAAPCPRRPAG